MSGCPNLRVLRFLQLTVDAADMACVAQCRVSLASVRSLELSPDASSAVDRMDELIGHMPRLCDLRFEAPVQWTSETNSLPMDPLNMGSMALEIYTAAAPLCTANALPLLASHATLRGLTLILTPDHEHDACTGLCDALERLRFPRLARLRLVRIYDCVPIGLVGRILAAFHALRDLSLFIGPWDGSESVRSIVEACPSGLRTLELRTGSNTLSHAEQLVNDGVPYFAIALKQSSMRSLRCLQLRGFAPVADTQELRGICHRRRIRFAFLSLQ
ncbi:hypothetical protein AURDEDRAFT_156016 [Auricularia subglabra TFB-10046 SS5]|nr:hypothetical protein AURDEDRAFT_156016 [Auricularia subglabra TFB-10046 SS5]